MYSRRRNKKNQNYKTEQIIFLLSGAETISS